VRKAFPALMFLTVALAALLPFEVHAAAELGQPAPALVVQELNGQTFDLATLRGKVVVINFWATWCPPCRQEMPALDEFYRRYPWRRLEKHSGPGRQDPSASHDVVAVSMSPRCINDVAKRANTLSEGSTASDRSKNGSPHPEQVRYRQETGQQREDSVFSVRAILRLRRRA